MSNALLHLLRRRYRSRAWSAQVGPMMPSLVTVLVGDTGIEPVTSTVSRLAAVVGVWFAVAVVIAGLGERVAGCRRVSVPAGVGADDPLTVWPGRVPAPVSPHPPHNCRSQAVAERVKGPRSRSDTERSGVPLTRGVEAGQS